jgi:hypothetical protein
MAMASAAQAEEVEKKWRLGLQLGSYSNEGKVPSDAANVMFIQLFNGDTQQVFDPRNDSAANGDLKIKSAPQIAVTGQYAINRFFLIEGFVGYQRADVGEVESQVSYEGQIPPETQPFDFSIFRTPVGEVEQIPIQLSAIVRFRPRSSFNPYMGAGLGYMFTSFEPTAEFDHLSRSIDANQGVFVPFFSVLDDGTMDDVRDAQLARDLSGAEVEAPGTFQWHLLGGAEYTFARKWSLFVDLRYFFASRNMKIHFNGSDQLGVSVPNRTVNYDSPEANFFNYGPYALPNQGLFDGGRLVPTAEVIRSGVAVEDWSAWCADPARGTGDCFFSKDPIPEDPLIEVSEWDSYCTSDPGACFSPLDGETDSGYYYVKGGTIDYGGFSVSLGVRYTF